MGDIYLSISIYTYICLSNIHTLCAGFAGREVEGRVSLSIGQVGITRLDHTLTKRRVERMPVSFGSQTRLMIMKMIERGGGRDGGEEGSEMSGGGGRVRSVYARCLCCHHVCLDTPPSYKYTHVYIPIHIPVERGIMEGCAPFLIR